MNFLKQGIQICAPDVMQDNRLIELYDTYLKVRKLKQSLIPPYFVEDKLWGVLKCEYKQKHDIDRQDEWFNHILAFYIANLMESARTIEANEEVPKYLKKLEENPHSFSPFSSPFRGGEGGWGDEEGSMGSRFARR
jgi:hypothetical protein